MKTICEITKTEKVVMVSMRELLQLMENQKINFATAYQRGESSAWRKPAKLSAWVDSVIYGNPIPPMYWHQRVSGGLYDFYSIDGQQRSTVSKGIADGDYQFSFDGRDSQIFVNLPKETKELFYSRELEVHIMSESYTDEEISHLFSLINDGVRLTPLQQKRGLYIPTLTALGEDILNHPVWSLCNLRSREHEGILMQSCTMRYGTGTLDSDAMIAWFITFKPSDAQKSELKKSLDILESVLKTQSDDDGNAAMKRFTKKTHLSTFLALSIKDAKMVWGKVTGFFSEMGKSRSQRRIDYVNASTSGSADVKNVCTRLQVLADVLDVDYPAWVDKVSTYKVSSAAKPEPSTVNTTTKAIADKPINPIKPDGNVYVAYITNADGSIHRCFKTDKADSESSARQIFAKRQKDSALKPEYDRWNANGTGKILVEKPNANVALPTSKKGKPAISTQPAMSPA